MGFIIEARELSLLGFFPEPFNLIKNCSILVAILKAYQTSLFVVLILLHHSFSLKLFHRSHVLFFFYFLNLFFTSIGFFLYRQTLLTRNREGNTIPAPAFYSKKLECVVTGETARRKLRFEVKFIRGHYSK